MTRPMSFPERLWFGYRLWRVLQGPIPDSGSVQYDTHTIMLQESQHPADKADTLVHELLHIIAYEYALFDDDDHEERVVTAMANGLIQLLVRNPDLGRYLLETTNDHSRPSDLHHGSDDWHA